MKPVRELFILEDHDCNYKIFSDINLAYDYVVEYIKENHNEEDAKELLAELEANIKEQREQKYGLLAFDHFYIDDYFWCYPADYYEREEK